MKQFEQYTFIDLTHRLSSSIPFWGEDKCGFQMHVASDYSETTEVSFRAQTLNMVAGIGTHIDAPAHCFPHAATISELTLEQLIVPGIVINIADKAHAEYQLTVEDILEFENEHGFIPEKSLCLVHTGWERFWHDAESYRNHYTFPSISEAAAQLLLKRNIVGLGIDTLSPDCIDSGYPVHRCLLGAGKYIIENITNAHLLPPTGSYIFALPMKIDEGTEAPLRVVAMISLS